MAIKVFAKAAMAAEDIKSYVGSFKFYEGEKYAAINDGAFVTLGDLEPDKTYNEAGDYQYNVYMAKAPAAATDKVVVASYAGISEGAILGNDYKMGIKLYDLVCPEGRACRFYRMVEGDKFWLSDGLFNGTPEAGKYAILEAGKTTLKPAAEKPEAGFCVKIYLSKDFNAGRRALGKVYYCEVVSL